jgi:hypothetical protein
MEKSNSETPLASKILRKPRESPRSTSWRVSLEGGASLSLDLAIEAYRGLISTPTPLRPAALAARRVLPVPRNGSSTHMFRLVKNSTNSRTRVSGKPAGWTSLVLSRRGGLCLNQDFVNLIQSLPESSFSRFVGLRFLRNSSFTSKSFIVDPLVRN